MKKEKSSSKIKSILFEHTFLKEMKKEHISAIADYATEISYKPDEYIFKEKNDAVCFYLILNGSVNLEIYSPEKGLIQIETIGDGEILGWSWLYPPCRWRFDARAITDVQALVFDGKKIKELVENNYEMGYRIHKLFAQ